MSTISGPGMEWHHFITFASDAELFALAGAGFLVAALFASLAERRRIKRARIDSVGWVPWTGVFLACAIAGITMIALGVTGLLKG